jgi:hypothetical protein
VDVELAVSITLDRLRDVLNETRELGLVVGRDKRPGDAPSRLRAAILTRRHRRGSVTHRPQRYRAEISGGERLPVKTTAPYVNRIMYT